MIKFTTFMLWLFMLVTAFAATAASLKLTAIKNHLCEVSPAATEFCPNR